MFNDSVRGNSHCRLFKSVTPRKEEAEGRAYLIMPYHEGCPGAQGREDPSDLHGDVSCPDDDAAPTGRAEGSYFGVILHVRKLLKASTGMACPPPPRSPES